MIPELAAAIAAGEAVVLATVVQTQRSAPRRAGAKMLVWADGRTAGTVGGGEMEHRVRVEAAHALDDRRSRFINYQLVDPLGGDPGVCGGTVDIYLEPYMPQPILLIVGAGHVGQAVAELASLLDYRIVVWDDRPELLSAFRASPSEPGAANLVTSSGRIDELVATLDLSGESAIVMVTRNVALDLDLIPALLGADSGYIGLMGSDRRWATTRAGLANAGIPERQLERIEAPIGIEIHAETPAEIAVAIMASVIANRRAPQ